MTALTGASYCASAQRAVLLILKNALRVATVNAIAFIVIIVGKLFVTFACGFVAFLWTDRASNFKPGGAEELTSQWLPVLFAMLVAFLVCQTFFDVYDLTINTILLCFCMDEEMGSNHAGQNLAGLLNNAQETAVREGDARAKKAGLSDEAAPVGAGART